MPMAPMAPMVAYSGNTQAPSTTILASGQMVQYGHASAGTPKVSGCPGVNISANCGKQPNGNCGPAPQTKRMGPPRPPKLIITYPGQTTARVGPPGPPHPIITYPGPTTATNLPGLAMIAYIPALPKPTRLKAITYEPEFNPFNRGLQIVSGTKKHWPACMPAQSQRKHPTFGQNIKMKKDIHKNSQFFFT